MWGLGTLYFQFLQWLANIPLWGCWVGKQTLSSQLGPLEWGFVVLPLTLAGSSIFICVCWQCYVVSLGYFFKFFIYLLFFLRAFLFIASSFCSSALMFRLLLCTGESQFINLLCFLRKKCLAKVSDFVFSWLHLKLHLTK